MVRILCSVPEVSGVILDAEHGAFSEGDLETLCALANLSGRLSIVRAAACEAAQVARTLDRGAQAVMLPRVRSVEEVSEAVSGAGYSPVGARGFDPTVSAYSYGAASLDGDPRVIVQIETRAALESVAEIAAVDAVSDLFVGPADLSRDLNGPDGEFFGPDVLRAMELVAEAVSGTGVGLGSYVDTPERAGWAAALGYSLLAVGSDVAFLSRAAAAATTTIART